MAKSIITIGLSCRSNMAIKAMNRRLFLASTASAAVLSANANRPNILLVTADDLGLYLGCYGEKRIATPHLDRFAKTGVQFTTACVAQASCSPSRSAMFTGLMPHTNGQYGLANGGFALNEEYRATTIPALMKAAGYRTGILGKLHVEPESSFPWDLMDKNNAATRHVRTIAPKASAFLSGSDPSF